jgi:hypothetical protein
MRFCFLILLFIYNTHSIDCQSSTIDVIKITTSQPILDEPKTNAIIEIIETFKNENPNDDKVIFKGKIGIETRGSSSQTFPKKPYGFEFRDDLDEDKDVSIFGWPADSDFILFASYNEKSLIQNTLAMNFANQLGLYGSRTRHVELYIDDKYAGVYVLMEKIKRSKGRLNLSKMKETDISGENLTGGYIFKLDKTTGQLNGGWNSKIAFKNNTTRFPFYQFEYPEVPQSQQAAYISNYFDEFENQVANKNFADTTNGYRKYIDVPSFANLMILNEISMNVDGYRISTFFHKNKNSKLKAGPAWDYDLSFGNADYCQGWAFDKFSYNFNSACPGDFFQIPTWWTTLLQDPHFYNTLKTNYTAARTSGFLRDSSWNMTIDSFAKSIEVAQVKNFEKWPILGTYVWPNPRPISPTWIGEVNELKIWFKNRLSFLDKEWLIKNPSNTTIVDSDSNMKIVPNPIYDQPAKLLVPKSFTYKNATLQLFDLMGKQVFKKNYDLDEYYRIFFNDDLANITNGCYVLKLSKNNTQLFTKLMIMR